MIRCWWPAAGQVERLKLRAVGHAETLGQADGAQQPRAWQKAIAGQADRRL